MKKKTHNYFLSLGMIALATIPVASVISCNKAPKKPSETGEGQTTGGTGTTTGGTGTTTGGTGTTTGGTGTTTGGTGTTTDGKTTAANDKAFLKRFTDAGADIKGKTDIAILGKEAKNVAEFKKVLILAGAKKGSDKYSTSGVKSLSNDAVKAIYDFYHLEKNKNVSLVKELVKITFTGTEEGYLKGKEVNLISGMGHIMEGLAKANFMWISKADAKAIQESKAKMQVSLKTLIDAKKPVEISNIAVLSQSVDDLIQGIIIMGGLAGEGSYDSTGLKGFDYSEVKALFDYYKKAENKANSLGKAITDLKFSHDELKTFPETKFVLSNDADKKTATDFDAKFKDIIGKAADGKTSVSALAIKAKDLGEFIAASVKAGALTVDKPTTIGGGAKKVTYFAKSFGVGRNKMSGTAVSNLVKYLKANPNKTIDIAMAEMTQKTGKTYSKKSVAKYLKAFPKEKFVYSTK